MKGITAMTDKLTHHHLTAELVHDECGTAIMLTQQDDGYNEPNTVLVHPFQLRAVCEQFGIIASDPQAAKTIATLQRRMVGLRERIDDLADWMAKHSDHAHADLSYETTQLRALLDLAGEWCADFDSEQAAPAVESDSTPAECTSAPAAQASLL
jgi:hypothetical protein